MGGGCARGLIRSRPIRDARLTASRAQGQRRAKYIRSDGSPPRAVKLPRRRPRSAKHVVTLKWNWHPAPHHREDNLYLSFDSSRRYWLLWLEWNDEHGREVFVRAYMPSRDTPATVAARQLISSCYRGEVREFASDPPSESDEPVPWHSASCGLLPPHDLISIRREIWPGPEYR